ncbi:MAG TPA: acylphosphatase [Spirochaetota bacterium]|nr:acylphosphatase [Spirochaetota bacterium]
MKAILYNIKGKVQGVGFRYFVIKEASKLRLVGYAKNLHNGNVEVYAIGDEKDLTLLETKLEIGPPGSRVLEVTKKEVEINIHYKSFIVEY